MKKQAKSDYYTGFACVVKDGVPCRIAPWFKELTSEGKRMVMSNRIRSAPFDRGFLTDYASEA